MKPGNTLSDEIARSRRPIYRARAWQQYIQQQEQTVLPRFVRLPLFLLLWTLFALLMLVGSFASWIEIPLYITGSGVILDRQLSNVSEHEMLVLIFLPTNRSLVLHSGSPIRVQMLSTNTSITGRIVQVEPGILSPGIARQRYALKGAEELLINQPSMVILASISAPADNYGGSFVTVQVQTGSQHLLPILLGHSR